MDIAIAIVANVGTFLLGAAVFFVLEFIERGRRLNRMDDRMGELSERIWQGNSELSEKVWKGDSKLSERIWKSDSKLSRQIWKGDSQLRDEISKAVGRVRDELRGDVERLRAGFREDLARIERRGLSGPIELSGDFRALLAEFAKAQTEMGQRVGYLEGLVRGASAGLEQPPQLTGVQGAERM